MSRGLRISMLIAIALAITTLTAYRVWRGRRITTLTGAVLRADADPGKQLPLGNVK